MADEVTEPWRAGVDVTLLTHTDVDDKSRNVSIAASDSSFVLHRRVETLRREQGLSNWSVTCDRALRIELAWAIDYYEVSFDREDFDVAYTIPPVGWCDDMPIYDDAEVVPESEVDTSGRGIHYSTVDVVSDMVEAALDEGTYVTKSEICETGVARQLGLENHLEG